MVSIYITSKVPCYYKIEQKLFIKLEKIKKEKYNKNKMTVFLIM